MAFGRPRGSARRSPFRALALGLLAWAVVLAVAVSPGRARAAGDPYLDFWTIETPHFRIHYATNLERVAERIADLCEDVHGRMVPVLGYEPSTITHVVVTDNSESANGSASALPYNVVRLFVTAPEDTSPLADYEDWLLELVTHEYTHILHIDNVSGVPSVLNAVLGKTFAPNQYQPRWIIEGLAVLEESLRTAGGRNRSSIFDMYLRADVLEGRLAPLDQMSNGPRRWPGGNIWYLYGSRFLTWISDTYGEQVMREIAADYGARIVPYGINRSVRRATGRTYEELYEGWKAHLGRLYGDQIARARAAPGGLREGHKLTHAGRFLARPRWVPASLRRSASVPEVLYYAEDGHNRAGYYRLPVPSVSRAKEDERELFVRSSLDRGSASFDREGNLYFSNAEVHKRIYAFADLVRVRAGSSAPDGDEPAPARERLTTGLRASDPDVRFDGRQIVYTVNRRGTQYLTTADVLADGTLGPSRVLVPSLEFQLAQNPRYSPDGRLVAYSSWSPGGFRDLRVVEVATGHLVEVTHDRALDVQPVWSPDGKTLYFSSDRTGIFNLYAYDLPTGALWQVTNVRTGALMPEPSPDGASLVYVGYGTDGYDLYGLTIDRASWAPAAPYVDDRPPTTPRPPSRAWARHPYRAIETIWPRNYEIDFGQGSFGQTLTITANGSDAMRLHGIAASANLPLERANPQASLTYSYGRLPLDFSSSFFRTAVPTRDFRISDRLPLLAEETLGWSNALGYALPRAFDRFDFSLGYTVSRVQGPRPIGAALDPQTQVTIDSPVRGTVGLIGVSFSYSNFEQYVYSVGPARGFSLYARASYGGRETASDFNLYSFAYSIARYMQVPWHRDHTLGLSLQGGISGGNYPRREFYYVGGYVDLPLLDVLRNSVFQGGFVLRGYPSFSYGGRQYYLTNAEYRAPLWVAERGLSTLPFYLSRVSGALFFDYGGAFNDFDTTQWSKLFHYSYGAELLIDTIAGYFVGTTSRLGYARGGSKEAYQGGQFYFVLSSQF
ncbi:MAG: BamA/TamA family outer membrane protein [Polyangiaceae bacterium]|nr:BamA/TamA family outer membrane protein [Polyangiaceae bacterium]